MDDVLDQLQAKVPHYISLVIDSYARGVLGVAETVEHADRALGQAAEQIARTHEQVGEALHSVATQVGDLALAPFVVKVHDLQPGDYATLAEVSEHYDQRHNQLPGGWERVEPAELRRLGLDPGSLHDAGTGFDAEVYRGPDGNYVVAYGGTRGSLSGPDWNSNKVGLIATSAQETQALALARTMDRATHGAVVFTGHSLGGQLAAVSALATGCKAVTFDAPPVSEATLLAVTGHVRTVVPPHIDTSMITNYWAGGDEVTVWVGHGTGTNIKVDVDAAPGQRHHDIQLLIDALPHAGAHGVDEVPIPPNMA